VGRGEVGALATFNGHRLIRGRDHDERDASADVVLDTLGCHTSLVVFARRGTPLVYCWRPLEVVRALEDVKSDSSSRLTALTTMIAPSIARSPAPD
jgi:hypothetical protein